MLGFLGFAGLVVFARFGDGDDPLVADESAPQTTERDAPTPRRKPFRPVRCPPGVPDCRAVTGRIVFVESVDPDGDGDLHVVVAAGSITTPGLTSIDVQPSLRPRRDPRIGDTASGAGPVQRGTSASGRSMRCASRWRARRLSPFRVEPNRG